MVEGLGKDAKVPKNLMESKCGKNQCEDLGHDDSFKMSQRTLKSEFGAKSYDEKGEEG